MRSVLVLVFVMMLCSFCISCATSRTMEDARVSEVVKDRTHLELLRDTFIQHDTHYTYIKGDTLRDSIVRDLYHIIYKVERDTIQDTLFKERTHVEFQKVHEPRWRLQLGLLLGFCAAIIFFWLLLRLFHADIIRKK